METCEGDYNMTIWVIHLDDIITFSNTFEKHLDKIEKVLTGSKENNLKLSSYKCFFIQDKVHFLGHDFSEL